MFKRKFKNLEKLLDISTNKCIINNVRKIQNNKTTKQEREEITMTKKEMRKLAKKKLLQSIAVTYYKLEDEDLSEEEIEEISQYINQYGEAMAKSIGERYYTM